MVRLWIAVNLVGLMTSVCSHSILQLDGLAAQPSTITLDMSPALFKQFASLDTGEIEVTWNFMSKSWSP